MFDCFRNKKERLHFFVVTSALLSSRRRVVPTTESLHAAFETTELCRCTVVATSALSSPARVHERFVPRPVSSSIQLNSERYSSTMALEHSCSQTRRRERARARALFLLSDSAARQRCSACTRRSSSHTRVLLSRYGR